MTTLQRPETPFPATEHVDARSALTASEIGLLERRLHRERDALREAASARLRKLAQLEQERGDDADAAAFNLDQHLMLRIGDSERQLLAEVERALAKVARGQYGLCEGTGEPIGFARLSLRPWARYSVSHSEQLERGQRALKRAG